MGDFSEALQSYKKAEEILLPIFGEEHPDLAQVYQGISSVLEQKKEHAEGLIYSQKALAIMLKVYTNKPHINVAKSYSCVGMSYLRLDNFREALNNFKEAFLIMCKCFDKEHPSMSECIQSISYCITKLNDSAISNPIIDSIYVECEKKFGKGHMFCEGFLMLKKITKENLEELLKQAISEHGEDDVAIADVRVAIGGRFDLLGKHDEALDCFQRALAIQEKNLGKNHSRVADTIFKIGGVKFGQKKYKEAMEYSERAFLIACEVYKGPNSNRSKREIIGYLESLIVCYEQQKESVYRRIIDIVYPQCLEIFGATHELTLKVFKTVTKLTLTDGFRG